MLTEVQPGQGDLRVGFRAAKEIRARYPSAGVNGRMISRPVVMGRGTFAC